MTTKTSLTLFTIAELKDARVAANTVVHVVDAVNMNDGKGGFYRWMPNATGDEDLVFFSLIKSNLTPTGRWRRTTQRVRELPQGKLQTAFGVKVLSVATTLDANGECSINLTEDNTPTGTALFSEVWTVTYDPRPAALTDPNNIVVGNVKSMTSKVIVCKFSRGNSLVGALGLTLLGMRAAAQGTPVNVRIEGA